MYVCYCITFAKGVVLDPLGSIHTVRISRADRDLFAGTQRLVTPDHPVLDSHKTKNIRRSHFVDILIQQDILVTVSETENFRVSFSTRHPIHSFIFHSLESIHHKID
jgi:hypothetical protein